MRSIHLLGRDTHTEWQLIDAVGGAPNRFLQLAQRISWGITQPDLCRVDVIAAARQLVRSHGGQFPAHLYDAWVWRARDPARGDLSLRRARALATPDHPLLYLLPTDAEWNVEMPAQRIVEIVPGRIWRVAHHFSLAGAPLHMSSTATIVKTASGDLAIINPVAFDDAIADQVAKLGPVRWICTQGKAHSAFVDVTRQRYPGSVALGTEGHLSHRPAAHLELDGLLGKHGDLSSELELIFVEGHLLQEVLVLHRPTSTLILQDFMMKGATASLPFIGRLYAFAWGMHEHIGFPAYATMMWIDMRAFHGSLRAIRDSGFARIGSSHGPAELADSDTAAFRDAVDHALEIGRIGHRVMQSRFFTAHPSFLRDSLRYLRSIKHAVGARIRA